MARSNIWAQSLLAVLTSLLFAGNFVAGKYITSEMSCYAIAISVTTEEAGRSSTDCY